jgi:hypothetical protein
MLYLFIIIFLVLAVVFWPMQYRVCTYTQKDGTLRYGFEGRRWLVGK